MNDTAKTTEELLQELATLRQRVAELEAVCYPSEATDGPNLSIDSLPHFAAIVHSSQDAILACDNDGTIISWNPGAERLYGYTNEEALGQHVSIIVPDDRLDALRKVTEDILQGRRVGPLESECRRKDGSIVEVSITVSPTLDSQGRVIGGSSIAQDITARRRAKEALRQSEEQHRQIFESVTEGLIILDTEGKIVAANPAACAMYGYQEEGLIGLTDRDVTHPDYHHLFEEGKEDVLQGKSFHALSIDVRKDGTTFPTEVRASAVQFRGQLHGLTIIHDITERVQAEKVLRDSEERYRTLIENIDLGITMVDRNHRIVAINKAQTVITGRPAEDYLGRECYRMFENREGICPHCPGRLAMQTGQRAEIEVTGVRHDGSPFAVRVQAFPARNSDGAISGFIEVVEDICDRKRAEVELTVAKQAAEAANRAKSEFLANMSHEIRTPMTAILGFADILKGAVITTEAREAAETIKRNGEYLLELINGILDLSKIEAGRLTVDRAACSPLEIAREVISMMQVPADAKRLDLQWGCEGPIPETISSGATRLRQILINLVGNAVKFTEVGSVRLVLRLLRDIDRPPRLQFDVIDTGIGMTPEQVSRLFQPFMQADSTTSRRFGGTGLGLTISKRLAETLGGTITVKTSPGIGSTFGLTVETGPLFGVRMIHRPESLPPQAAPPAEQADVNRRLHCRVLLVEDGPDNQRLITFVLKKAGAQVCVAENGKVAVEMVTAAVLNGTPFDLVLMDIQMPVMDGYEATRRLRETGQFLPVIALTAHAMKEDRQRCLDAGCDAYLAKPIDRVALLSTVAQYANQRQNGLACAPGE